MIKRFRAIIRSNEAPEDKETLWLKNKEFFFYKDGEWSPLDYDADSILVNFKGEKIILNQAITLMNASINGIEYILDNTVKNLVVQDIIDDATKVPSAKVFYDSIDEKNSLLKLVKDGETLYASLFKGLKKPTINTSEEEIVTTDNTATVSITNNESGAEIYYRKSDSKLTISNVTTDDLTKTWEKGTSVSVSDLLKSKKVKWYIYAVATKNGLISEVSASENTYRRKLVAPTIKSSATSNYATSSTISMEMNSQNGEGTTISYGTTTNVGTTYSEPFDISSPAEEDVTYYAVASCTGWEPSGPASKRVIISRPYYYYTSLAEKPTAIPDNVSTWTRKEWTSSSDIKKDFTFKRNGVSWYPAILIPTKMTSNTLTATSGGAPFVLDTAIEGQYPENGNSFKLYTPEIPQTGNDTTVTFNC